MVKARRVGWLVAGLLLLCGTAGCGDEKAHARPDAGPSGQGSPSAPPSPYDEATRSGGDVGPHEGENNAWKYRAPLSPDDERLARATERKVRPVLTRLRESHEFSVGVVEKALLDLGYPRDHVQVAPMRMSPEGASSPTPVPGAVFQLRIGDRACVHGDVRPSRLLIQVEGTTTEGTCEEPFTH